MCLLTFCSPNSINLKSVLQWCMYKTQRYRSGPADVRYSLAIYIYCNNNNNTNNNIKSYVWIAICHNGNIRLSCFCLFICLYGWDRAKKLNKKNENVKAIFWFGFLRGGCIFNSISSVALHFFIIHLVYFIFIFIICFILENWYVR